MAEFLKRYWFVLFALVLVAQLLFGLSHISDPFIDGRYHYNWGPPYWLLNARATNDIGIFKSFFGVVSDYTTDAEGNVDRVTYYSSHPQFIGPTFAFWTKIFGYSEQSSRMFPLLLTMLTTALFMLGARKAFGDTFALFFGALFAFLPVIYIYGKRLDHEVLVLFFLSLSFLGYVKLFFKERYALPLLYAGLIGMTISDWSGFVLLVMIGFISLFFVRNDRVFMKRVLLAVAVSFAAGLLLFALQNYLQGEYENVGGFFERYAELFVYRADVGSAGSIPWSLWLLKQLVHVRMNFSWTLAILGAIGLFTSFILAMRNKDTKLAERAAMLFMLAVFLGEVMYIVFIKQGSFVHLFYQNFFAVPLAFGIVWLARATGSWFRNPARQTQAFIAFGIFAIVFSGWHTYRTYTTLLHHDFNGDRTDIELVKHLRDLPNNAGIIAVGDANEVQWFANPNIEYYAGRKVEGYTFEHVPLAPYQIVPARFSEKIAALIANGTSYGIPYATTVRECGTNFCLLELITVIPAQAGI